MRWIAWAPFVGVFIARISRGRTIRAFVLGVLLVPTTFSLLWFTVFGGAALYEELFGAAGLVRLVREDVTTAVFLRFDRLPLAAGPSVLAIALVFHLPGDRSRQRHFHARHAHQPRQRRSTDRPPAGSTRRWLMPPMGATDGALTGRRLRVLEDTLGFFPSCEAAVVARAESLERYPRLAPAFAPLAGRIDTPSMRRMNAAVRLEGQPVATVAAEFLRDAGLLAKPAGRRARGTKLVAVRAAADRLEADTVRALGVAQRTFPQRAVLSAEVDAPLEDLAAGRARLAVLGAERFFRTGPDGAPGRDPRAEAVVVLGTRAVHVVRRRGDRRAVLAGRVGLPPAGSGAAVAERLVELAGVPPAARAPLRTLLAEALALRTLSQPLVCRGGVRLPYLRATRIPPETYTCQPGRMETLGAQVLLAGPAPPPGGAARVGGPAAALRTASVPLTPRK